MEKKGLEFFDELIDSNEREKYKAEAFDKIAEMYYCENFGTASKSELDLLMFSIYMETLIKKYSDIDNTLDYNACSDYKIAKKLGVTQERVRSLKVKKQARYPHDFDWRKSLKKLENNIVYDESKKRIIIPSRDPNLYYEIMNFIEENGGYIEIQKGTNYLQMRPDYFFMLLYQATVSEKDKQRIKKEFCKALKQKNKEIEEIETDDDLFRNVINWADLLVDIAKTVAEVKSLPVFATLAVVKTITGAIKK